MSRAKIMCDTVKPIGRALIILGAPKEADVAIARSCRAAGIDPATIVTVDAGPAKTLRELLLRLADALGLTVSRDKTVISTASAIASKMYHQGVTAVRLAALDYPGSTPTSLARADDLCGELLSLLKYRGISLILDRPLGSIGLGNLVSEREFRAVRAEKLSADHLAYLLRTG